MKYLVSINTGLAEHEQALLQDYWAIKDGKFIYKAAYLAQVHGLSVPTLTHLASKNSVCHVSFGHCLGCGDELLATVVSKSSFLAKLVDFTLQRCADCQLAYKKRQAFEQLLAAGQVASALGPNAVELRTWETLPAAEREVLRTIVCLKEKELIYPQLFKNGNVSDKEVWALITQLVKRGLLVIHYEPANGRVVEGFTYPPSLESVYNGSFSSGSEIPSDTLSLRLNLSTDKSANYRAAYTGVCTMQQEVVLRRGDQYAYAGWLRKDNTVLLQLLPFERLVEQTPGGALVETHVLKTLLTRFETSEEAVTLVPDGSAL